MTKNIMSVAAAAVLFSTGAQAFDTNSTGGITNREAVPASYIDSNTPGLPAPLARSIDGTLITGQASDRLRGDALIFPAFQADASGWESEIVLRNNHKDRAVIAKAVIYNGTDSAEVRDFNIYLSPNDQVRFRLTKEGKIESTDGSIVTNETISTDDVTKLKFADELPFSEDIAAIDTSTDVENGYIIVYGMAETNSTVDPLTGTVDVAAGTNFDHNHTGIWQTYRAAMDAYRPGWRSFQTTMRQGVYTEMDIATPNQIDSNVSISLHPVTSQSLSGTVRILNATDETRDLILPATALADYTMDGRRDNGNGNQHQNGRTDGTLMLWGPTEYAAIADRCIDGTAPYATYNANCVAQDTATFLVDDATYTFENDAENDTGATVANKLIMTQPTKRFLAQIFPNGSTGIGGMNATNLWHFGNDDACNEPVGAPVVTGLGYGVVANFTIFDDDERKFGQAPGETEDGDQLTSPGDLVEPDPEKVTASCNELVALDNLERGQVDPATGEAWPETSNGFVTFDFANSLGMIPAIVTQMTATRVGDDAKINWVYAPSARPAVIPAVP